MSNNIPLWEPSQQQIEQSNLFDFIQYCSKVTQQQFTDYHTFYNWSIKSSEIFWSLLWDYCSVIGDKGERILIHSDDIEKAQWFPDARLNFAQNLLQTNSEDLAIIFKAEDKVDYSLTFYELYQQVAAVSEWLKQQGIQKGDRVAALMPNMPETIVAMLATASLGAVWTSTSPDFGEESVIDRFGQTQPKILFTVDGYFYNGKTIDIRSKVKIVLSSLPTLQQLVEIPLAAINGDRNGISWKDCIDTKHGNEIAFTQVGFNDPLYILYSSRPD